MLSIHGWSIPSLGDIRRLRTTPPTVTQFMLRRERLSGLPRGALSLNWCGLDRISPMLRQVTVESEDFRFFQHRGVSAPAIRRAMGEFCRTRRVVSGGSTITQQLAKNLYLSPDRTLIRKLCEASIALCLELFLGKQDILELYLNIIEWGPGVWGCRNACRYYFQKEPAEAGVFESVLMATLIPAPLAATGPRNVARIRNKQAHLLRRLSGAGLISPAACVPVEARFQSLYERLEGGEEMVPALRATQGIRCLST